MEYKVGDKYVVINELLDWFLQGIELLRLYPQLVKTRLA